MIVDTKARVIALGEQVCYVGRAEERGGMREEVRGGREEGWSGGDGRRRDGGGRRTDVGLKGYGVSTLAQGT